MSTLVQPDVDQAATPIVRRERVLTWRDLGIPLVCAIAVTLELSYLHQAQMGQIERQLVEISTIWDYTLQHIQITATITVLVLLVAVPLGVAMTRKQLRWLSPLVLGLGNVGQAAPIVGLIAIIGSFWIGFWPVVLIISAFSILPVLRNTIVGIQQVDPGVIDAARGMGMSSTGILLRVELPMAVPIIAAGARTALILAVAVVPLGTDLNAGGLGQIVFPAIKLDRLSALVCGGLFIAVLALLLDWLGGLAQRALTPRGIR